MSEGDSEKADTLTKAIKAGAVSTVSKELEGAVEQSVQQALNDALFTLGDDISPDEIQGNTTLINTVGGLVDTARTSTFDNMVDRGLEERADRTAAMSDYTQQVPYERSKTLMTEVEQPAVKFDTMDMLRGATETEAYKTAFGLENFGRTPVKGSGFEVGRSPYEAEGRSQLGSGFDTTKPELYGRGFTPEDIGIDPALEQEFKDQVGGKTKKRTRKLDQPKTGILPRRGERFPDVGLDRPSRLGQSRVDDFLMGVRRDDKGDVANLSENQQRNIRKNVQEHEDIRQKLDAEDRDRQSRGFGPMSVQERFDRQQEEFTGFDSQGNFLGGMYVGGVPTKPMKPQRLKKGGLAKPKVKPKRMKKGGLASKKK